MVAIVVYTYHMLSQYVEWLEKYLWQFSGAVVADLKDNQSPMDYIGATNRFGGWVQPQAL